MIQVVGEHVSELRALMFEAISSLVPSRDGGVPTLPDVEPAMLQLALSEHALPIEGFPIRVLVEVGPFGVRGSGYFPRQILIDLVKSVHCLVSFEGC